MGLWACTQAGWPALADGLAGLLAPAEGLAGLPVLAEWPASLRAGGLAGWLVGWLADACRRASELADRLMGAGSGSSEVVRERLSPIQMLATRSPFIESHVKIRCSKGIKSMH